MNQLSGGFRTISWRENKLCFATLGESVVLRTILVTVCVSADDDGRSPTWDKTRDVADDDWLTEDSSIQNVSNRTVRGLPHLLEVKLFYSSLVWCDCGALNSYFVLQHSVGAVNGYLIVCSVTILNREVVVFRFEINVRENVL